MSGSNSSAHADKPEPLALTVHTLQPPDLADAGQNAERRTLSGRVKMLLVLLMCAAPVILSYITYYVIRPEGRTNYGTLVQPSRSLPALPLTALDGSPVDAGTLKGQWLLVAVGSGACDAACDKQLFMQRQLREMLGRERDRLDKVWFITDNTPVSPTLQQALGGPAPVKALRVPREALAAWLAPEQGQALEAHLYVVDPLGEWMMRMPADPQPGRIKRDLDRLLRASAFWHKPDR
jgi:hypothetical protein